MSTWDDVWPLCFVLMPFGTIADPRSGVTIDFDAVYQQVVLPAIEAANLKAVRADEEQVGGFIHKSMYERLILCDYAVADLTTANASVYYQLGVRHALRPRSTVLIFADGVRLPVNMGPMRGLPYHLRMNGVPSDSVADRDELANQLRAGRQEDTDSPVFQLLDSLPYSNVNPMKTEVFRDQVEYSTHMRELLAEVRHQGVEEVRRVREQLGDLGDQELGVVVDLLLSFRAVAAWADMITLVEQMPSTLAQAPLVREQYALALHRVGQNEKAEQVVFDLIAAHGPSSETYGLLGRIYRKRSDAARQAGQLALASGLLNKAIDAYVMGFERDWRDAYLGINAVQLMELRDPPDPRRAELLPVVTYSVKRRAELGHQADYWDYATLLELAVLDGDEEAVMDLLPLVLAKVRESWEPMSTALNLRNIRQAREMRGPVPAWMAEVERALEKASHR